MLTYIAARGKERRHVAMWVRRMRNQRGAAAVEAALLTPLLTLILFGIIEMSFYMRDVVSVSSAVHVGTRIGSTMAGAGPATCTPAPCTPPTSPALVQLAANAMQQSGMAMPQNQINFILIYNANTLGYPLPAGNKAAVCSTDCVKYVWSTAKSQFVYSSGSWSSPSINACINDVNRMSVGVIMNATHPWITGLFGNGATIQERNVMQFEPLTSDSCKPGLPSSHG
jgi:Flp pilus assembly pilin Flp